MDIKNLLDYRNIGLWEYLNSICDIAINAADDGCFRVYSKNNSYTVYVPDCPSIPSFTHELLHILLMSKSIRIGNTISLIVREKPFLSNVLPESIIDHISNCLSHLKMLPLFVKMGFDNSEFLDDYHVDKLNGAALIDLKRNFKKRIFLGKQYYQRIYVVLFIGKYFAARTCPNSIFDYAKGLGELKDIDRQLYNAADSLMSKWDSFDIEQLDDSLVSSSYYEMQFEFAEDIENWLKNKRIK